MNARRMACLVLLSLVASCAGAQSSPDVSPRNAAATLPQDEFNIGGYSLWMHCEGVGLPTVVLEAGLGSGSMAWRDIVPALETETRVCAYDRAGLGQSDRRPESPAISAGAMADELARLLDAADEPGPYLLVGHSYGGMIVRLFAARHPDDAHGIVFVDAASEHQFTTEWDPNSVEWDDGSRTVDRDGSAAELAAVDNLGAIPIIVLTEGQRAGFYESLWAEYQDELASLSTDTLHMVARDAGHVIQDDAPALVIEAVRAVLESIRSASPLAGCDARFETVGAECLDTTMVDRLAAWDVLRSAVVPSPGDLPSGVYRAEITGEQSEAVSGKPEDFEVGVWTWTIAAGRWRVSFSLDGGTPEETGDVYASIADEVTLRLPIDYKVPGSPGVNRLKWTVDPDGTLHFEQIDDEPRDPWFSVPWVRVRDAPD